MKIRCLWQFFILKTLGLIFLSNAYSPSIIKTPSRCQNTKLCFLWRNLWKTIDVPKHPFSIEETTLVDKYINDVTDIRKDKFSLAKLPLLLLPAYAFKRRWLQAVLAGGSDVKDGLVEEWGVHILAEALFVTITAAPIVGGSLIGDGEDITLGKYVLCFLIYFTSMLQLCSIFGNIICVCAAIEVPVAVFKKWILSNNRLDSIVAVGQLHTLSTYMFLITVIYWPFAEYDDWHLKLLCGLSSSIPAAAFILGPYQALNKDFYPVVQHVAYPGSKYHQDAVDADLLMFFDGHEMQRTDGDQAHVLFSSSATPGGSGEGIRALPGASEIRSETVRPATLALFLQELGLSRFEESCRRLGIELYMIPLLEPEDFKAIGMTIGQRVVLLEAYKALEKEGLAPLAVPRSFVRVREALQIGAADADINVQL